MLNSTRKMERKKNVQIMENSLHLFRQEDEEQKKRTVRWSL